MCVRVCYVMRLWDRSQCGVWSNKQIKEKLEWRDAEHEVGFVLTCSAFTAANEA